jgi:hypothetical protein
MGELLGAAAGIDLKFRVRIETDGKIPKAVIEKLNYLLNEVSGNLKFK